MPESKLSVVVIGCGGMADTWVKTAVEHPEVAVVGLVDLNREAAEAMAGRHGLPAEMVYGSLKEAVSATGARAVFDVTVPVAHDKVTIEALGLGCHVLGEKPMSDTIDKARAMVAAAEAAGKVYAVTQTRRPLSFARRARKMIEDGVIGAVQEIHSDFQIGARFGGFREEMDHPLILDMAIHTFDNARQIGGADPVRVYCHSWNPKHSWYRGDASAVCIFEMQTPAGDPIVYTYRGSWTNEGHQTAWESDWRIVGDRGTIRADGGDSVVAEIVADVESADFIRPVTRIEAEPMEEENGHRFLIHEFVEAVLRGGAVSCPAQDNIKSLAMVLAAVDSARLGERVDVTW